MNTKPGVTRVLCFGDSNTWGYEPLTSKRYPANIRWTGVLQAELGDQFEILEEGLNGRTTDVDYVDRVGRNGKTILQAVVESHIPYDAGILMIGTNDFKKIFRRSGEEVANAIKNLILILQCKGLESKAEVLPKVILVSPPGIDDTIQDVKEIAPNSEEKRQVLARRLAELAKELNVSFLDAATVTEPSPKDGVHLEPESHVRLGKALATIVQRLKTATTPV